MKRILFFLVLSFYSGIALAVTPLFLEQNAKTLDGEYITVEGELIGEPLTAPDGVWLNIVSKGVAVGVFVGNTELLKPIEYWGSYIAKGDVIAVSGVFYRHCEKHNEEGIHAEILQIVSRGFLAQHKISREKRIFMVYCLIICLTLLTVYFIKKIFVNRNKKNI